MILKLKNKIVVVEKDPTTLKNLTLKSAVTSDDLTVYEFRFVRSKE